MINYQALNASRAATVRLQPDINKDLLWYEALPCGKFGIRKGLEPFNLADSEAEAIRLTNPESVPLAATKEEILATELVWGGQLLGWTTRANVEALDRSIKTDY